MNVDVSIDKCALIGDEPDVRTLFDYCPLDTARASTGKGGVDLSWNREGVYIECRVDLGTGERFLVSEDGSLVYRGGGVRPQVQRVRVEFNPNRISSDGWQGLSVLGPRRRFTRLDVALDYAGVRPGDLVWHRSRVKQNQWYGVDGVSEALYLGRWTSGRFVRIYDKAREEGRSDLVLTRCEGVSRIRPGDAGGEVSERLFDGVTAHWPRIPKGIKRSDAGKLALMHHYPEVFKEMRSESQRRIREIADRAGLQLDPLPAQVYRDRLDEIQDMVSDIRKARPVRIAEVYKEMPAPDAAEAGAPIGSAW